MKGFKDTVLRGWRGDETLGIAFWLNHVIIVGIALGTIYWGSEKYLLPKFPEYQIEVKLILGFVYMPTLFWSYIGIWKSAKNSKIVWMVLSRLYAGGNLILFVVIMYFLFSEGIPDLIYEKYA